jgi:opacity protein-like surface antigen
MVSTFFFYFKANAQDCKPAEVVVDEFFGTETSYYGTKLAVERNMFLDLSYDLYVHFLQENGKNYIHFRLVHLHKMNDASVNNAALEKGSVIRLKVGSGVQTYTVTETITHKEKISQDIVIKISAKMPIKKGSLVIFQNNLIERFQISPLGKQPFGKEVSKNNGLEFMKQSRCFSRITTSTSQSTDHKPSSRTVTVNSHTQQTNVDTAMSPTNKATVSSLASKAGDIIQRHRSFIGLNVTMWSWDNKKFGLGGHYTVVTKKDWEFEARAGIHQEKESVSVYDPGRGRNVGVDVTSRLLYLSALARYSLALNSERKTFVYASGAANYLFASAKVGSDDSEYEKLVSSSLYGDELVFGIQLGLKKYMENGNSWFLERDFGDYVPQWRLGASFKLNK